MSQLNILDRLCESLECSNDTELSKVFGVARTTLGSWRARGSIPIEKVCDIAEKNNLSLDYLYFGKQQEKKQSADIDIQMLGTITFEFELIYDYLVKNNPVAKWLWLHNEDPEIAKSVAYPSNEELNILLTNLYEKNVKVSKILKVYNKVIRISDETERTNEIKHEALVTATFLRDRDLVEETKTKDGVDSEKILKKAKKEHK